METVLHLERMFYKKTETFVINQISAIDNYKVDIACIESLNNGKLYNKLISPPGRKLYFRTKILRNEDQKYLEKEFSENAYALIHTHFISDATFFHPLTKKWKIPKVASAYGYDVSEFPARYFGLGKQYLARVFDDYDLILAMSDDMKNDLLRIGCPDDKIKVHYHGINTAMFANPQRRYTDSEIYKLISVGTVCEKKGQHLVVEALNILINRKGMRNIHYRIIGSGPYENLVRKKVNSYHLSDYVTFQGHVNYGGGLVKEYEQAQIFIHPCITDSKKSKEGIPGVIVEAMANGLPVITTRHAGIPSVVFNDQNGLLLDENKVDQIADSIIQLTQSGKLRARLGEAARDYAVTHLDMYSKARILEDEIYAGLIR